MNHIDRLNRTIDYIEANLDKDIEQTYDRIYGSWVPLTGNTPTMDLDIIVVDHRFKMQSNDSVIDILIPIEG